MEYTGGPNIRHVWYSNGGNWKVDRIPKSWDLNTVWNPDFEQQQDFKCGHFVQNHSKSRLPKCLDFKSFRISNIWYSDPHSFVVAVDGTLLFKALNLST